MNTPTYIFTFSKVAIECDLYFEEIEIKNENEKLFIQLFGKNTVTLKKLYKKKKTIDHYFFLLLLFNILSNLPYSIIPIQKVSIYERKMCIIMICLQ